VTNLPLLLMLLAGLTTAMSASMSGSAQAQSNQNFNQPLIAAVTAAALQFMGPRTLDAIPMPQMTLWGLRGLSTLDARLTPELLPDDRTKKPMLRLSAPGRVLFVRPIPAEPDAAAWGEATGQVARAAWDASDLVRQAGTQGILRAFFDELFNHLDPYSRYVPPSEAGEDRGRRAGRAWIGLDVELRRGAFVVSGTQGDGPAAQAGVRPGDRILAVDGASVQGADLQAIVALLAGPTGSVVELTLRTHDGPARTVALERISLPPETVSGAMRDGVLVLRVTGFARNTAARLAQELITGLSAVPQPRGVVVDLRGNRGGLLRQAVAAAAMMQPEGVVAVTAGRHPQAAHEFRADGRDLAEGLPVIVMVDGRTASSAEILAASLSDQRRAVVVGSATLGKGLVQTVDELPDGGELLVTWSRVLAPAGWPIQGLGVLPQVCTSLGEDNLTRQLELLAKGVPPLGAAILRHRQARAPLPPGEALAIRSNCPAAEGRDSDLATARFLVNTPAAYRAALVPVGVQPAALGISGTFPPPAGSPGLTAPPPVPN
jgi:carboxyl-terminal processing protease